MKKCFASACAQQKLKQKPSGAFWERLTRWRSWTLKFKQNCLNSLPTLRARKLSSRVQVYQGRCRHSKHRSMGMDAAHQSWDSNLKKSSPSAYLHEVSTMREEVINSGVTLHLHLQWPPVSWRCVQYILYLILSFVDIFRTSLILKGVPGWL